MNTPVLHYLYDPFCGWCYAAAPLVSAAQALAELSIQPHGLGMLSGERARMMSPQWRDFVRPHEQRITALSGQAFGSAYVDGLQERTDVRLDSSVPIGAMLAAQALAGRGLDMLKRLQTAYYQEGRPIAEIEVVLALAAGIGLDAQAFGPMLETVTQAQLAPHLDSTNVLMQRLQVQGVPALALEHEGGMQLLPFGKYLSRPGQFQADLLEMLGRQPVGLA